MSTPLCQIAMSVTDLPRTHAWYTGAFGFVPSSGTNSFKGFFTEKVQGIKGVASTCWWLMDGQDFFQIELFRFHRPETRLLPKDWRPCDIGYSSVALLVNDLDETLARLRVLGSEPMTAPQGVVGERRVCVRDPEGVLLELFESDPLANRAVVARPDIGVLTLGITLSVPDLRQSREFFCNVMGLEEMTGFDLHKPEHESLWGLEGATAERLVLRAGESLVELVQYHNPVGKPQAEDYRISDQGLLNLALGYRKRGDFNRAYKTCLAAGIKGNWYPVDLGAWKVVYVNDHQGFSVEMLHVLPMKDAGMGFKRQKASPNLAVAGVRNLTVEMPFNASAEVLWKALSEHETMTDWWPLKKVSLIREGEGDRNGVGAVRRMEGLGPALEEEVVAWYPGRGYDYKLIKGAPMKDHFGTVRILPVGEANMVQWRIQFRSTIPGGGAITQWILRKLIEYVLGNLKRNLESVT